MNNYYLLLITDFNNNLKLKKLNIDDVVIKMNQIEDLLKLNYTLRSNKNKVFTIDDGIYNFNSCLFGYIDHYKHLSNDKKRVKQNKSNRLKNINEIW